MELVSVAVAITALIFSLISYFRSRTAERIATYAAVERDASDHIFSELLERDSLNELFYYTPTVLVPSDPNTPLERLTTEQRALLNFGTIVLNYFEQMIHFEDKNQIPNSIFATWKPWLNECVRAPHFIWVWRRLHDHYEPGLAVQIQNAIKSTNELSTELDSGAQLTVSSESKQ